MTDQSTATTQPQAPQPPESGEGAGFSAVAGSGPIYPWPPSPDDVKAAVAWARNMHRRRERGEDAMAAVLAWEIDRITKQERETFRLLQDERTTGDYLASALIGEFEKTEALARYAATLGDDDAQRIATVGNVPWKRIKQFERYLKSLGAQK